MVRELGGVCAPVIHTPGFEKSIFSELGFLVVVDHRYHAAVYTLDSGVTLTPIFSREVLTVKRVLRTERGNKDLNKNLNEGT